MKHKVILDYPHLGKDKKLTTIKKNTILVDYKVDDVVIDPEVIENNPEYFQEVNWKQELRLFFKENKEKTFFIFILFWLLVIAQIETYSQLTTSGTFAATMRLAIPILLAGLGGIFSERSGVVNIGLEGMMIMGTWFGAWAAWLYGPWWGVAAGIFGGLIFGLIHAIATVSFQVDHIVSGVAINILAAGTARFFSVVAYANESQGGATQSPRISGEISSFSLPFVSGGTFLGNETSDWLRNLEDLNLFFISDISGLLGGLTRDISYLSFIALSLVPICMWILWSTPFGLQLRSVGEFPIGSESLGINVYLMKYILEPIQVKQLLAHIVS